jgi:peptidoglycan LD-endopeptidase LytH
VNINAAHFEKLFKQQVKDIFPILGVQLNASNAVKIDLSVNNLGLSALDLRNTAAFSDFIFKQELPADKLAAVGGYFENRAVYSRSQHFGGAEPRSIHLGIDIWMKAGTPVYAPFNATVHSFADNVGFGNYGPTLILRHFEGDLTFYTLYGHLSLENLKQYELNMPIKMGQKIANIGPYPENGDWPPHLHFQLMTDMLGWHGDFPGVCAPSQIAFYQSIIPNPNLILGCSLLNYTS